MSHVACALHGDFLPVIMYEANRNQLNKSVIDSNLILTIGKSNLTSPFKLTYCTSLLPTTTIILTLPLPFCWNVFHKPMTPLLHLLIM